MLANHPGTGDTGEARRILDAVVASEAPESVKADARKVLATLKN